MGASVGDKMSNGSVVCEAFELPQLESVYKYFLHVSMDKYRILRG